jgi:hypothetical protein
MVINPDVFCQGNIDSKRYQIIAVETMMNNTYAIVSPNSGEELSDLMVF